MPRCTVCSHPQRAAIDAALVASEAHRSVAKRFSVSAPAVFRHQSEHLPAQMVKAKEVSEVAAASALVKELRELTKKTGVVLARAMAEKNGAADLLCAPTSRSDPGGARAMSIRAGRAARRIGAR